jgi:hypothetical protein
VPTGNFVTILLTTGLPVDGFREGLEYPRIRAFLGHNRHMHGYWLAQKHCQEVMDNIATI